jgi:MFS family permease
MAAPLVHDRSEGQGEFARGWPALVASFLGIGFGMSPMFMFTAGIFAGALQTDFGWSRSQIMGAAVFDTIAVLTTGLMAGRLIDRIGARPVVIASCILLGLTTMALSLTTANIAVFYAIYALRSFVAVGTMPPAFAKVVSACFNKRRGFALGIVLAATGVAGVILPPFVHEIIVHYGWRAAYVGLGLLPLVIALPSILLLLPGKAGSPAAPLAGTAPPTLEGVSVAEALRGHRYWVMGAVALAAGIGLGGILSNLVPLLVDRGFSPGAAASQLSLYGLVIIVGRLAAGWLLDRHWAPAVGSVFLAAPALGAMLLWGGADTVGLVSLAVILVALASGAEFDLMAFLTAKYFGRRNFTALYSGQNALFAVGAGLSPAVFGRIYDLTHAYTSALLVAAVLFAASAGLILLLGRYPRLEASRDLVA